MDSTIQKRKLQKLGKQEHLQDLMLVKELSDMTPEASSTEGKS